MVERKLKIIFMGTPDFAVPSLQYILDAGYPVLAVVTAPDKPGGRGMKEIITSPVKQFALRHHLPVLQPTNLKSKEFIQILKGLGADLQIVVAFRMLPEIVWNMPPLGTVNLHGSLLPAYRGAAPIQRAIMNGEHLTGVTTFRLQHEIDAGEILLQRKMPITDQDDAGTLYDRMMEIGAGLIVATLDQLSKGESKPQPQDLTLMSHAPKIHHEDAHIHWKNSAAAIHNLIRGMSPFPGAWTTLDHQTFKVLKASKVDLEMNGSPGFLSLRDQRAYVQTGDGALELLEVQLAGKKKMSARDFFNGYKVKDWYLT
ncbi:MAG TPA: methionyl-tRNA formyltransferase [Saprospiraceae bacterium]|nr:methionyl-tRNA formyltransferase [Saprospiraceae bacterium]